MRSGGERVVYSLEPAYSGGFCFISGWDGPAVVDIESLIIEPDLNALLRHDLGLPIGRSEVVKSADNTQLTGRMIIGGTEAARSIGETHASEGQEPSVNWKPSIGVNRLRDENMTEVPEGEVVEANGQSFTGPCTIVYEGHLSEMSLVTAPGDVDASAVIQAALDNIPDKGNQNMKFEEWLVGVKDLTPETFAALSDEQQSAIRAEFDTLSVEAESDDPKKVEAMGDEDPPKKVEAMGDEEEKKVSASLAETRRVKAIETVCGSTHRNLCATAIESGWSSKKVQAMLGGRGKIEAGLGRMGPGGSQRSGGPCKQHVLTAALAHSLGMSGDQIARGFKFGGKADTERVINASLDRQYSGINFSGINRASVQSLAPNEQLGNYATPREVFQAAKNANWRKAMSGGTINASLGGFSTISSFEIFEAVVQAFLIDTFETADVVYPKITKTVTALDTNEFTEHQLTLVGLLKGLKIDGKVEHGTVATRLYPSGTEIEALTITIPQEIYINDRLGSLADMAMQIAELAPKSIEYAMHVILRGMTDGTITDPITPANDFFSAESGNYVADITYDTAGLGKMLNAFANMQDDNGIPIKSNPNITLMSSGLFPTAQRLHDSNVTNVVDTIGESQIYKSRFTPIEDAYLNANFDNVGTGGNDAEFFMFGDVQRRPAMKLVTLQGYETPTVETELTGLDTFGTQHRVIMPFKIVPHMVEGAVWTDGPAA